MSDTRIEDMGISDRVVRALRRNGIRSASDLSMCDRLDLWKLRGIGPKGRKEILAAMARHGVSLRGMV